MTLSSPKTLLAVINARHRPEWRRALRDTWMKQVPKNKADAFFFVGTGEQLKDQEQVVEIACSDKYEHLPEKVRAICRWAIEKDYAYMLKTDDDTMLKPNSFLDSGYHNYDYSGSSNRPDSPYAIPFGFGYCMSRKSMEIIASSSLPGDGSNDDEKWVAYNLSQAGILLTDIRRYYLHQFPIDPVIRAEKRSLRAPVRPQRKNYLEVPEQTFSYCVHTAMETHEKVAEYYKLWERYKETSQGDS